MCYPMLEYTLPIPWKQDQKTYQLRYVFGVQWMALTCRATFSGPYRLRIIPFSVLMHGKKIGFNWTNVVSLLRLELSTSSIPSAFTHSDPGIFFWAHAVRARSSDGHKNVLSLIGYSHLLENR